ncbi:hypothetical protein FUA23_08745 [Neolewinella aurantiaca]|uniref:Uncharacterized protein n=1 Tax=Neolewinella aurantiaca TaxID=2602767 RepID=A0A5C7FFV8_9BACT|nr:hypothetical protein [Neolewinella aurantiaca]TXF89765.1 hypothetical protein FUA23_08745 [Neolewinella aurantiaca]
MSLLNYASRHNRGLIPRIAELTVFIMHNTAKSDHQARFTNLFMPTVTGFDTSPCTCVRA